MKRQMTLFLLSLSVVLILTGCKVSPEQALTEKRTEKADSNKETNSSFESTDSSENTAFESEGKVWNAKLTNNRPLAVMLDNHAGARPQAGLKDAEIVIEALAEGNITRYMAFFFDGMPESIGPIRSARPYFLDRAMEYNAVYVHVGGSPKALKDIKSYKVADLDGLSSSNRVFFRKSHKKTPHNLYSSFQILKDESMKRKYKQESSFTDWIYAEEDAIPEGGTAADFVKMPYRKNDGGYVVSYSYFADLKAYQRYVNGKVHTDEIDNTALTAKNIIIQVVPTRVVDNAGRLDLELVGSGNGWWLSDGVKVPITWQKDSRTGITTYTTSSGNAVLLNPGNVWIQIIPKNMVVLWEK